MQASQQVVPVLGAVQVGRADDALALVTRPAHRGECGWLEERADFLKWAGAISRARRGAAPRARARRRPGGGDHRAGESPVGPGQMPVEAQESKGPFEGSTLSPVACTVRTKPRCRWCAGSRGLPAAWGRGIPLTGARVRCTGLRLAPAPSPQPWRRQRPRWRPWRRPRRWIQLDEARGGGAEASTYPQVPEAPGQLARHRPGVVRAQRRHARRAGPGVARRSRARGHPGGCGAHGPALGHCGRFRDGGPRSGAIPRLRGLVGLPRAVASVHVHAAPAHAPSLLVHARAAGRCVARRHRPSTLLPARPPHPPPSVPAAVGSSRVLVVSGETGCGKTTQVPQFVLDDALRSGTPCNIVCTQVRRQRCCSSAGRGEGGREGAGEACRGGILRSAARLD